MCNLSKGGRKMNFCPNCGSKLYEKTINDSLVKSCNSCEYIDWNNWVNVSCVIAAFTDDNEMLLVRLKGKDQGKLTFPGGYRDLGETLDQAAHREFNEETGMVVNNLELYKTYTKDEQRLNWIVYKGKVQKSEFVENKEVSEVIYIRNILDIDCNDLRGKLTKALLNDLMS